VDESAPDVWLKSQPHMDYRLQEARSERGQQVLENGIKAGLIELDNDLRNPDYRFFGDRRNVLGILNAFFNL
jgi:hypothetical protein